MVPQAADFEADSLLAAKLRQQIPLEPPLPLAPVRRRILLKKKKTNKNAPVNPLIAARPLIHCPRAGWSNDFQ